MVSIADHAHCGQVMTDFWTIVLSEWLTLSPRKSSSVSSGFSFSRRFGGHHFHVLFRIVVDASLGGSSLGIANRLHTIPKSHGDKASNTKTHAVTSGRSLPKKL
jgi:hypothetical protein